MGCTDSTVCRYEFLQGTKETPGPGTYGKGGIPHAVLEEKNRKSTSTVGLLDAGSSTARSLPMVVSSICNL